MRAICVCISICTLLLGLIAPPIIAHANLAPPSQPVKLIFIHHSTGENWLTDGYGDLGRTLGQNNYFVSDTNYGWGPDAIGDRTDIPNWVEWFRSPQTPNYVQALFNENEQHASYTRTLPNPGGENQIILFKSCFPNSDLAGNPKDPPATEADLTVGGAKYVYNEILKYFATRPDKMFVLITAPPLSDGTHAANARALTQWLMNDWLRENNYSHNNVFVYDFYNVLTSSNAHHRVTNGQIDYVIGNRNTLFYPSEDDHPSVEGSRKATQEFVPVLNLFYARWKASNPAPVVGAATATLATAKTQVPVVAATPTVSTGKTQAAVVPPSPATLGLIDDFEGAKPDGTSGWETYRDESTNSTITCAPVTEKASSGSKSMRIDFKIAPGSWATCILSFDQPQNWSAAEGLAFSFFSTSVTFDVSLWAGPPEARETYVYVVKILPGTSQTWAPFELRWDQFRRADWEEKAGTTFARPDQVSGITFGFNAPSDAPLTGTLWVDNLHLSSRKQSQTQPEPTQTQPQPAQPTQPQPATPQPATTNPGLPLCGSGLLPLFLMFFAMRRK